jgi:phage tail-like protein
VTKSTADVAKWLATVKPAVSRTTAKIAVMDAAGEEVASWSVSGVYPVRWTGPTLDVGQNQAATEVLELCHIGFAGFR